MAKNDSALIAPGTVGMDLVHPYCIYVDGKVVATYDSESEASEHYNRLAGRSLKGNATDGD
jgi:hypothetical protein